MAKSRSKVFVGVALAVRVAVAQAAGDPVVDDAGTDVEVVAPGGLVVLDEVVVESRERASLEQATTQVVSVLSAEDIARTGEGDIAGALSRVTGLSVVGGGFVYVRGLGDRYSLALLNGSPLPSPEPLRRAVPLDLFPSDVIASSLVQKTYSPNYTGEFGGGVINLTTLAIPRMPFLKASAGISGDSETTDRLGYDHYGSRYDWTGFDSGLRNTPPALSAFLQGGEKLSAGGVDEQAIAGELVGWRNAAVQKIDGVAPNYSTSLTGGNTWSLDGGAEIGLIATGGFDNKWRTRDNLEQTPASADLAFLGTDFRSVATENRIVANGLLGLGVQQDGDQLRWTNLYVHDTLKRTSLAEGTNSQNPGRELRRQDTAWYERELMSTQLAGTLQLDPLTIDARASRSQSRRNAPFELGIGYSRSNDAGSPYGAYFINGLDNGATGYATVAFSRLKEDLSSAGVDLTWRLRPGVVLSGGYDYAYTARDASRREFQILAPGTPEWASSGVFMLRADYLLNSNLVDFYDIGLIESTEEDPAFDARLLVHGLYSQVQARLAPGLELSAGARFERGKEVVRPKAVFAGPVTGFSNRIENDYVLPAATLTWKIGESQQQQVRLNVSRTLARPQFRELMAQAYYDPESNRTYRGNPLLDDSRFLNAEARYEWYFASEQRLTLAGFYKQIERPIEVQTSLNDNSPVSSFANAPEATLFGAEFELQKYLPLGGLGDSMPGWLGSRRLVTLLNYTWTNSSIRVKPGDRVAFYTPARQDWDASLFFRDGSRLTGQSDHLVNLQLGLEHPNRLAQQTILLSYASERVTSRGPVGSDFPDIRESPGLRVDFVVRQGLNLFGFDADAKFEARNLLARGYREFQRSGANVVYFNRYDVGRTFNLSLTVNF